jgi:hypothetical protein
MTGRTMDVRTITCCMYLGNEISGLKDHETLAPANATYARKQIIWRETVSLPMRE